MQTFLPHASFDKSAECLDMKRLGKQRVETLQILKNLVGDGPKNGWKNHPAVKMWQGHEGSLLEYGLAICKAWTSRGYKDTCAEKMKSLVEDKITPQNKKSPFWLGDEEFHSAHRSNLIRKNPEHYKKFGWVEKDDLPYVWPSV